MVKHANGKIAQFSGENMAGPGPQCCWPGGVPYRARTPAANGASPAIPIPESLVVTAAAYRKFMGKNRLDEVVEGLLQGVDVRQIGELRRPAAQIKSIIHTSPIPEPMFSSINAACQRLGHHASIVWPVTRPNHLFLHSSDLQECPYLEAASPEEVLKAIKTWWASLFDATAIYFREINRQSHRDADITVAAQQLPSPSSCRMLLPFATVFPAPGMS